VTLTRQGNPCRPAFLVADALSSVIRVHQYAEAGDQDCDDRGNERVAVSLFAGEPSLQHFILTVACQHEYASFFKAAAPEWNHEFRWRDLDTGTDAAVATALQSVIGASFSDAEARATGHHPQGVASLLGIDVWENAYCLDFGNQAQSRLRALLENPSHWHFTFDNLAEAVSGP